MSNARNLANLLNTDTKIETADITYPLTNFSSTGIDDNADATAITIDSSERVGVGDTSPLQPLHVKNSTFAYIRAETSASTKTGIDFGQHQDGSGHINLRDSGDIKISTGDTERMRIDSSGLVGIGTTSPSSFNGGANNLVVGTGSGSEGISIFADNSSNSAIFFADGDSTTTGQINYLHGSDAFTFHTNGGTERMRIHSNGNVSIGTGSASANLHVQGTSGNDQVIVGNSAESTQFRVRVLQDDQVRLYARDGDNARDMVFYTGTGERMRIRSGGFVAINTTGGSAQFQVLASSGDIVYFQNNAGTGVKLTAGNQSFSAVSDENKKENIVELDKQQSYDNIKKIRAVTYKFKDMEVTDDKGEKKTYKDDKSRIGFLAQDWETKYSQLVNTDDDGVKSLLYTETTPVLLSALQKAQEKIEELEARITALEGA